jgi:GAF domain-containing protein
MSGSTGGAAAASLEKAIHVINRLAVELDIHSAVSAVRHVALELLDCQRVTLFLALNGNTLRCKLPEHEGGTIEVMFGEGIAGTVAQTGQLMNIPDAYSNNLFNNSVDLLTGFKTKQILCCAIQDYTGETIAVLQALNTRSGQCFTAQDETNLKLFGVHLGNTLSKAKLHEQVKREKERMATLSNCFKRLNAAVRGMLQLMMMPQMMFQPHTQHQHYVLLDHS